MPLKDPIERKEYDKKYYKKNKYKINQTSKLWKENNIRKIRYQYIQKND